MWVWPLVFGWTVSGAGQSAKGVLDLPDAPDVVLAKATGDQNVVSVSTTSSNAPGAAQPQRSPARRNHRVVRPWEYAEPLSAGGKLRLSIVSRLTFGEAGATIVAAGWSQMNDIRPHAGTDAGAFGERLGDLALKQTSQSFFSFGVFAAVFHDDPRYYVIGHSKPVVRRALDSALGIVIARKDDGGSAVNWPRFAGIGSAVALTNVYYPAVDHGFANSGKAFASSLGSAVLNNELHEFSGDLVRLLPRRCHR